MPRFAEDEISSLTPRLEVRGDITGHGLSSCAKVGSESIRITADDACDVQ